MAVASGVTVLSARFSTPIAYRPHGDIDASRWSASRCPALLDGAREKIALRARAWSRACQPAELVQLLLVDCPGGDHMKKWTLIAALALASAPLASPAFAGDKDEKVVSIKDLPAPARKAILREANGAPILKVEMENEKGRTLYEAHVKKGKDEIGIVVDANGTLVGKHSEKNEKGDKD
jgi:hypothetical protein